MTNHKVVEKYLFSYIAYGKLDGLPRHEGEEIETGEDREDATNKVVIKLCASANNDLSIRITGVKKLVHTPYREDEPQ